MRSSIALSVAIAICSAGPLGCGAKPQPQASSTNPMESQLLAAQGHERSRRYDLAETSYRSAIELAQTPAERSRARRELADALIFWGKYEQASQVLEDLVAQAPGPVAAWHDLGLIRQKLGNGAGAEKALRRSISLAPKDPRSHIALAALLVNQKRLLEAQRQYQAMLKLKLGTRLRRAVVKALDILARELGTPRAGP